MGKTLTRAFRLIFQVITAFLFLGLLLTAVGGIILKTSTSILQSSMKVAFKGYEGDADNLRQFADFLLEIADTMAVYCIVFGMVLAVLALIGLIASYCGWYKVLKIYAVILIVVLVVQIIIVAVIFSSPTKYANGIVSAVETLLTSYGNGSEEGNASTATWNVLMETSPKCCGMDGHKDFVKLGKSLPLPCCNITAGSCNATTAQHVNVTGCRHKVELFSTLRSDVLLHISISMIFMEVSAEPVLFTDSKVSEDIISNSLLSIFQAVLIVLVILLLCTAKDEKPVEG